MSALHSKVFIVLSTNCCLFGKIVDWQKDCLTKNELKAGENFVYILPTSGGKTLIAEILIMKCLLCQKKNAILVLPYVAIVQEKVSFLLR